ncbi:hypothetical protein OBO34_21870, partial [Clostridiales Family XIII bacterium ASD5510]|nr:hypothetical protein [Hominibacterium faecale]
MAIQNRRGAYGDFNPDKLKSGEWATVMSGDPNAADGRATYLCYEPGVVKRMATFEDMEENVELSLDHIFDRFTADMQKAFDNANAALATMQTATTAANNAASNANTKATAANTAATNANSKAALADTAASNANAKASAAETAASNANAKATAANTAAGSANTAATNANSKATAAEAAAKTANDIATLVQQKLNNGDFNGKAATVSVGNVTTGAPGSQVQITARGTSTNVILDFAIPQGQKGDPGTITNLSGQPVTFTVASSDVDIATGETLATIFGKLLKSVQTLRTGLAGKAASSHNHSATNITSGTLPVTRGGTGQTTAAGVKSAFGVTALETSLANLISDETIAAAQAAGIDLSGGGVLNLNRLVQLFLTN